MFLCKLIGYETQEGAECTIIHDNDLLSESINNVYSLSFNTTLNLAELRQRQRPNFVLCYKKVQTNAHFITF